MADWEAAERVQKNDSGQYRAFIGGEWVPVEKAQKNESGQFRVMRSSAEKSSEEPIPTSGRTGLRGQSVEKTPLDDIAQYYANAATGASGLMRGGASLLKSGLGDFIWPKAEGSEGSTGKIVGQFLDPVALGIGGVAAKAIPYAPVLGNGVVEGLKALGRNIGGGAITGGIIGGLSDEGTMKEGALMGAVLNQAIPGTFNTVANIGRKVKDFVWPSPGLLGVKAAGDKADDVIRALENAKSPIPGMNLTAGQAAVPANSAEFAALQKAAAEHDPSRYVGATGVQGQQEGARRSLLGTISKTPEELQAAVNARSAAANKNYKAAFQELVTGDEELKALSKNPYFRDEIDEALKLAKAKGIDPRENVTQFLHFIKEGIDSKIQNATKPDAPAISNAQKAALVDVKNKLVEWLGSKNKAYEFARAEHARLSKPINQMELGQDIERSLVAPVSEAERVSSFGSAVRKAETDVSKASGFPRIEDLTPRQRKALDAIEANLKLDADYKKLSSAGKKNLEERIGAPEAPPTGFFEPIISAARSWLNRALGSGYENSLKKLAPIMEKNPAGFAQLMREATPAQRQQVNSILSNYIARGSTSYGAQQGETEK